jgi:hypothetical protein
VVEVLGQADVAVVQAHNAKARIGNLLHHGRRPGNQLHAQAHDEQHHGPAGAVAGMGVFNLYIDAIGFYLHEALWSSPLETPQSPRRLSVSIPAFKKTRMQSLLFCG